jgi:polyisoprenoid-binding protein YceI
MRRGTAVWMAGLLATMMVLGCGGTTPVVPTPSGGGSGGSGGSGSGGTNTPPIVQSIVAGSDAHAEVGTPIALTATVMDAETPVDQLAYKWSAPTGTFTGSGASVSWTPSADAQTPADITVTLTVTETYGAQQTNTAAGTVSVHVNNSPKELADLSLRFLGDFADSVVSPDTCVSDFSTSCNGKKDEFSDITNNRHDFLILASTLRHTGIDAAPVHAKTTVHTFCAFTSRVIAKDPWSCNSADCPYNSVQSVQGDCYTTNVYEQGRWWLCDSHFNASRALTAFERAFFGVHKPEIP